MTKNKLNRYDETVIEQTEKLVNSDFGKNVINTISKVSNNPIGKAGLDFLGIVGNTVGLAQSGAAKLITIAAGKNNPDKGIWGYTPTDAMKDIKGESLTPTEATLGLALDIFADPLNIVTGGLHKISKAKKGLSALENIIKSTDDAKTFTKLSIDDLSKVADTEIDKLTKSLKTADKTQQKGLSIDIENLQESKKVLDKANKKGFQNLDEVVDYANKNMVHRFNPKNWAVEDYKKNLSSKEFIEKAQGGNFNKGAYHNNYQLGNPTRSIIEKKAALGKLLTADFQKIEVPTELQKIFDTTFKRGKETLSPKTLEYASVHSQKSANEIEELYDSFYQVKNKIKYIEDIEPEQLESLKGLLDIFEQDTLLDLKRTREGLKKVTGIESKNDFKTLLSIAKEDNISYADLNRKIINYIETGEPSTLSKKAIDFADKNVKPLYKRVYQLKRIIDKQIGYNDSYNPRRLKRSDLDLSKLNQENQIFEIPFSFEKSPKMRLIDSKNPAGAREVRNLTTQELQAYNELNKKNRIGLIEDVPTLMKIIKDETVEMYTSKIARSSIKNYEIPKHLKNKAKDYTDITVHGVNASTTRKNKTKQEMVAELSSYGAKPREIKDILSKSTSLKKEALNKYINKTYPNIGNTMGNKKFDTKIKDGVDQGTIQVPKDISKAFKEFYKINDTTPNLITQFIKDTNNIWKGVTLAFAPRYYINNIIDNAMILLFDNPKALKNMVYSFKIGQGKAISLKNNKGETLFITPTQLAKNGILEADYGNKNLKEIVKLIGKDNKNALQSAIDKGFNMANFIDDHYRTALAIEELKQGKTLKQTAKTVQQTFYDPQAVSENIKTMREYIFPFIGFTVDNLPKATKRLIKNPQKIKAITHITDYSKREDEGQGFIDPLTASTRMIKIGDFYLDLEPKMSMLQPITLLENIAQALLDPKNDTVKDLLLIPYSWVSPYKSIIESGLNYDVRSGRQISSKDDSLIEVTQKRIGHIFKAYASVPNSIRKVFENEDYGFTGEEGLLNSLLNFGDIDYWATVGEKLPTLFLGTQYYSNFKKVARDVTSDLKKDINSVSKKMETEYLKLNTDISLEKKEYIKSNIEAYQEQLKELYQESSALQKSINELKITRASLLLPDNIETPTDPNIIEKLLGIVNEIGEKLDNRTKEYTDPSAKNMRKPVEVQALEVFDGDTIKIMTNDGNMEIVRIAGIDSTDLGEKQPTHGAFSNLTREQNEQLHKEAKEYTLKFLQENENDIVVKIGDDNIRDNYNRLILTIKTKDGRDLSEELLERGLAEPFYRGKGKRIDINKYKKAYSKAKKQRQGVFRYISLNEGY